MDFLFLFIFSFVLLPHTPRVNNSIERERKTKIKEGEKSLIVEAIEKKIFRRRS